MRNIAFLLLVCAVASGCSTTVHLRSTMDANRKVAGGSAILRLRSGEVYEGHQFAFAQDTTCFVNETNDSLLCICSREIVLVQVHHHGGGALEGLMLGGLGGVGAGLVGGSGMGSGGDARMGRGLLVLGGMVLGGIGGAIVGGAFGHNYTFIMPRDSADAQSPGLETPNTDR
jgi:hypothetical protein